MPTPDQFVTLVAHALQGALAPVLARLAALEAQPQVPGPPGPPGPPGAPGTAGLRYEGVHDAGRAYDPGAIVTHSGSAWCCTAATTATPGASADGWQLMVKRGRDGRDRRAEGEK